MNKRAILSRIKKECEKHNVKLITSKGKKIYSQGNASVGFFTPGINNKPRIHIATGGDIKIWIPVLIHEFSHLEQYLEKDSVWYKLSENGEDCTVLLFDDILTLGKKFDKRKETKIFNGAQELEHDCETRAIKNIKKFIPKFDLEYYAKASNSYLYFYTFLKEHKKWYKIPPYSVDEIVNSFPGDRILSLKELRKKNKKLDKLYLKII